MCLCFFDTRKTTIYDFFLFFNREEVFSREAIELSEGNFEDSNIIAGKDKKGGGSWLGFNKMNYNIAFLTNKSIHPLSKLFFAPKTPKTRGNLIIDFIKTENTLTPESYILKITNEIQDYMGFNLVVGNLKSGEFYFLGNALSIHKYFKIPPGIYSMCNLSTITINTKGIPKQIEGLKKLKELINSDNMNIFNGALKIMSCSNKRNPDDFHSIKIRNKSGPLASYDYGTKSTIGIMLRKNQIVVNEISYFT